VTLGVVITWRRHERYGPEPKTVNLEDLTDGVRLEGVIPGELVSVVAVQRQGPDVIKLFYESTAGAVAQRIFTREEVQKLTVAHKEGRPFDAPAEDFRLVAECQRIKLAGLWDPMLAVTTSDIQPLPHQLKAVYGELLPRRPLRFLLADDPGAGKTIMAGLYIKELVLREDVRRCLIVAPGGLVDQWQDELFFKFGLRFEIFSTQLAESPFGGSVFDQHPLLIARMDQLARNELLTAELAKTDWDLVVVDEAHRMGAHYYGNEVTKTKRFQLGEVLRDHTRHLLLMTATPHSGVEEDFQLFLTLLDEDIFEGRYDETIHTVDTKDLMRRMIKEDLLTFEGKKLFPERIAQTVPYELSPLEQQLYEDVTTYVKEGMNRADKLDPKRRNTVGFALTVLQRRLASSPEAILRSLERRTERLERRKQEVAAGKASAPRDLDDLPEIDDSFDDEEYSAEELEGVEDQLVDAATAAETMAELDTELLELRDLTMLARRVRAQETDRKWSELRTILQDETLATTADSGERRKLIIFTEHRDTLNYLQQRIGSLIGRPDAVRAIHGGVSRSERRQITEEFTKNPDCEVLLATDAAGEGLNLQAAHLMVNYDLPWNPNRIEQRFGRIHRIGQKEVCRLWNLVADDTREGEVFTRLLAKVEEQRKAYGGKVFDVLGAAFAGKPLRSLLMEAIRYGDLPETRAQMELVIDASVGEGIPELLREQSLASSNLREADIAELRRLMDEARARRLQPHYIEGAFKAAFARLGGRIPRREAGRFEITNVPVRVRDAAKGPVATAYARVCFDTDRVDVEGTPEATLLAPGQPLHDAVADLTIEQLQSVLDRGAVLISPHVTEPRLLVGVREAIADATDTTVAERFSYAYVAGDGTVAPAGPAPYLDCVAAPLTGDVVQARRLPWLVDAEERALTWITANQLSGFLADTKLRREAELRRVREHVSLRLIQEHERLIAASMKAEEDERLGKKPKQGSANLLTKAGDLDIRREKRLALLDRQLQMQPTPPRIATAALVLPPDFAVVGDADTAAPVHAIDTRTVERRAVDLVMATERALGRQPIEQAHNNPGFDILSSQPGEDPIRIEVKGRIAGAEDFFITHNEVIMGLNTAPRYRLALVSVSPDGPAHDQVRYVQDPFAGFDAGDFNANGHYGNWTKTWAAGREPF
jgi:superfamily II DNA or RNA helicase